MGFPNMKYLDPETQGLPIKEQTFYKEYQDNNNDLKQRREDYNNKKQDMANNTFIKLFQQQDMTQQVGTLDP